MPRAKSSPEPTVAATWHGGSRQLVDGTVLVGGQVYLVPQAEAEASDDWKPSTSRPTNEVND